LLVVVSRLFLSSLRCWVELSRVVGYHGMWHGAAAGKVVAVGHVVAALAVGTVLSSSSGRRSSGRSSGSGAIVVVVVVP
jgi:hypothetical protein